MVVGIVVRIRLSRKWFPFPFHSSMGAMVWMLFTIVVQLVQAVSDFDAKLSLFFSALRLSHLELPVPVRTVRMTV